VGSKGDSYDNAVAESTIGLYKTELIERPQAWNSPAEVELAAMLWVNWNNTRRLHSACGHVPPAELEDTYYRRAGTAQAHNQ
jgi:transposase InsO family protein